MGLIVDHQGSQAPSAPSEPPSKFNRKTHSPHPRQKQRTLTAEPLQPAANIPTELTQKTSAHMPRRKPHSVRGASSHRDRTHLCAGACDLQSSVCASSASLSAPSARRCCCGHRGCVYVCVCPYRSPGAPSPRSVPVGGNGCIGTGGAKEKKEIVPLLFFSFLPPPLDPPLSLSVCTVRALIGKRVKHQRCWGCYSLSLSVSRCLPFLLGDVTTAPGFYRYDVTGLCSALISSTFIVCWCVCVSACLCV